MHVKHKAHKRSFLSYAKLDGYHFELVNTLRKTI